MRQMIVDGVRVQMCVTSPPYWGGLRDYGHASQIGLERDPSEYVATLVDVFRLVRELVGDNGTLWLNLGDVFAASGKGGGGSAGDRACWDSVRERKGFRMPPNGYKMKDLTLIPFQVAHALRCDGWYLRQTIIWSKPSAIEPTRVDRPATSHEYVFLMSKEEQYFVRYLENGDWNRSVWTIPIGSNAQHPAVMPLGLVERCLMAGSHVGDVVLDPFFGSGTVGEVAQRLGRKWIGCDLQEAYAPLQARRTAQQGFEL